MPGTGWQEELERLQRGVTRRWTIVFAVSSLLVLGRLTGTAAASWEVLIAIPTGLFTLNYALQRLAVSGWHRRWLLHSSAAFDLLLAALLVLFYGAGGLALGFVATTLPYSQWYSRLNWGLLALAAGIIYVAVSIAHEMLFGSSVQQVLRYTSLLYVEAVLLMLVLVVLGLSWSSIFHRVAATRSVLARWEAGSLDERAPAQLADELGLLDQTVNRILDHVTAKLGTLNSEATQLAHLTSQLSISATQLAAAGRDLNVDARGSAGEMDDLGSNAQDRLATLRRLAQAAESLGSRAERVEREGTDAATSVTRGQEHFAAIHDSLTALGADLHGAASAVDGLAGSFDRVSEFAIAISKIARQTHVLALNAAIEAARAAEHGQGFSVLAQQVRTLAGEAGKSARDVAETVGEVRVSIEQIAETIGAGEEQIREITAASGRVYETLSQVGPSVAATLDVVGEAVAVSRRQIEDTTSLAAEISDFTARSDRWSSGIREVQDRVADQLNALIELSETGRLLAGHAARLREITSAPQTHVSHTTTLPG